MSDDKLTTEDFIPYTPAKHSAKELQKRANDFRILMEERRSVRHFSDESVPRSVLEEVILTASSAPSGAHKQPWTFCLISNKELKSKIRELAEAEEIKSYNERMSEEWLEDLKPLGTNWQKEFIDIAPWIIVVMKRAFDYDEQGNKTQNYYVNESVGIASGFLLAAIHQAGLASLTHTPSPMNFLAKALGRPDNERPYLLIPVGYPTEDCEVPNLKRKGLEDIIAYYD